MSNKTIIKYIINGTNTHQISIINIIQRGNIDIKITVPNNKVIITQKLSINIDGKYC